MMHGYGIQIERSKFAKQKTFDKLSLTKEKTELLDVDEEKKNLEGLNEKSIDDSFYEGEFCFGYRHGIGRYYYKKGSYLYGEWRFDKSIGNGTIKMKYKKKKLKF